MSTMTPADRLMQSIRVRAPAATDAVIALELFNAMDEFFKRTMAWRERNDIHLFDDRVEYDLGVPAGAAIVRIIQVLHNGLPIGTTTSGGVSHSSIGTLIPELTFPDGDAEFEPSESDISGGGIFTYAIYTPEFITISVAPDADQIRFPLSVELALTVDEDCLELDPGDWQIPEWMYGMFFQDWLDGTIMKLASMAGKPWANKDLVLYHGRRWRNALGFRKQEANRGFVYAVPGFRFRRW